MPSAPSTYNEVINRLQRFAAGHYNLRSFTHGQIDLTETDKFPEFPWMHAVPITVNYAPGARVFVFEILFMDLPRDKEDKAWNQSEALSDTAQIAEDLINEIVNGHTLFGDDVLVSGQPVINLGIQEFTHVLTGSRLSVSIEVPNTWDACDIPASWTLGENGETGGPGDGPLLFQKSIIKADGIVTLVNDVLTPGNSYYYGTNSSGTKGWFVLPGVGGGAVDSVNGQTGVVVLDAGDVGADPAGSASTAQAFAIQRANHTGTQLANTISDFAATVRSTLLTGLAAGTNTPILATDQLLAALANLQAQISAPSAGIDYTSAAAVVGFSSLSTNSVRYSYDPFTKVCHVIFTFIGTSDATVVKFELPFTSIGIVQDNLAVGCTNNGFTSTTPGRINIVAGTSTCNVTRDRVTLAWTASGTKIAFGQFFFIAA